MVRNDSPSSAPPALVPACPSSGKFSMSVITRWKSDVTKFAKPHVDTLTRASSSSLDSRGSPSCSCSPNPLPMLSVGSCRRTVLPLCEDGKELEGNIGEPLPLIWVTLNSVRSPNLMYCETSTRKEVVQRVLVGSFYRTIELVWPPTTEELTRSIPGMSNSNTGSRCLAPG